MNLPFTFFYDDVDSNHLWSSSEYETRDVKLIKLNLEKQIFRCLLN